LTAIIEGQLEKEDQHNKNGGKKKREEEKKRRNTRQGRGKTIYSTISWENGFNRLLMLRTEEGQALGKEKRAKKGKGNDRSKKPNPEKRNVQIKRQGKKIQ